MEKVSKKDGESLDIVNENIEALRRIFPEAFTEDGIDFETLRQLLGGEIADGEEKYGLNWHGKKTARQISLTPSMGTLRPCPEESLDWDKTRNVFIEGDNLEVLKLLQRVYGGKIKMIYIDPPYNTGNDFVYTDNFRDNISTYLRYTGQVDNEDNRFSSNTDASGRKHTNWLNMMYPRLKAAKNLLRDDGVIFISIGDEEVSNLKALCNEIFGEDNFEGHIHWRRRHNQPNDKTKMIGLVAEHIISFAKNSKAYKESGVGKIGLTGKFSNPDDDPRGDWSSKPWKSGSDQSGSRYTITLPSGDVKDEEWMGEESTFQSLLADNRIIFPKEGTGLPRKKYFKSEREEEGQCATNWWHHEQFGHNQEGNNDLTELMDGEKNTFSNPKPVRLIKNLMSIANCKDGDIILDFFAGSATAAQAAFEYDDKTNFILIQIPEPLNPKDKDQKAGHAFCMSNNLTPNIAELSKERIRRASKKNRTGDSKNENDLGFKVFKLSNSNFSQWNPDPENLSDALRGHTENLLDARTEQDILYELLLKRGVDLTAPIEQKEVAGKVIYSIGYGVLFACLDKSINQADVETLGKAVIDWHQELEPASDTDVFFRDSAFEDDIAKTNMAAILEQNGIARVRSL